jgi:hypothetical protein
VNLVALTFLFSNVEAHLSTVFAVSIYRQDRTASINKSIPPKKIIMPATKTAKPHPEGAVVIPIRVSAAPPSVTSAVPPMKRMR